MSKLFALLTTTAFTLSAPINARTMFAPDEMEQSMATAGIRDDIAPPECQKESTDESATAEATGGMPDTEATASGAQATACCWVFYLGRWMCMYC